MIPLCLKVFRKRKRIVVDDVRMDPVCNGWTKTNPKEKAKLFATSTGPLKSCKEYIVSSLCVLRPFYLLVPDEGLLMDPRYDIPRRAAAGGGGGSANSSPALGAQSRRRKIPPRPADFKLQIIIIGSRGVGKTSLMERYTDDTFCEACKSTVGEYKTCSRTILFLCFCQLLINIQLFSLRSSTTRKHRPNWHINKVCILVANDILLIT